jgi:geranylgeranyl reductase family protein
MSRSCDVIVVGAGPAGSIAALVLARAGVKVRLLDRSGFPRPKLCGDTLNPGAMAILERLGGLAPLAARIRARALALTGMIVTGPAGESVAADYPHGLTGAALTRSDLDLLLLEAAAAAGAGVDTLVTVHEPLLSDGGARVTGVRLKCRGREERIDARLVIAADGRGSRLASTLGLSRFAREPRRWAFGSYFEGVTDPSSRGEMHIRQDGYIGVAPLPGGLTNVCVVRENPRVDQRRVVSDAVARDSRLRDRFVGARQVSETVALGPLAIDSRAAGCPGLLLAGDAAGFVDPMTGDGLRFALSGGELAALAALRELASGLPEWRRLGAERNRQFSTKWRINRTLRATVGSPRALGLAARVARSWPASVEYLIGVAGDVALARP